MGGKFIQKVAVDAPGNVRRMVALTPVPAGAVPFDEQGWGLFSGAAESLGNRRAIIDFTTGSRLSAAWLDHMAAASWANCTKAAFAGYLLAWAKADFHEAVTGSEIPIKVIVGQHDGAITADAMKATYLTWHKRAELEVMPNAGHYPMNETPDRAGDVDGGVFARLGCNSGGPSRPSWAGIVPRRTFVAYPLCATMCDARE